MKLLTAIYLAMLSLCGPSKVIVKDEPPFPVEHFSDYDRARWEEGCTYDRMEWGWHQVLEWDCK